MTRTIVAQAINRLWETYGAGSLEKNAAAQYFYELRKPSLDVEAFGEDFCKLASTMGKDPWRLAVDIYDNYSFLEKQSSASAKFCIDWSNGLVKKASLLLKKTSAMAPEVLKQTLKASRAARSTAGMPVRNIPTPEGMASQRAQATVQRATQGRALAPQQAQSAGTNVQGLRTQRRLAKSKLPPKPVATAAPVQTQAPKAARPQAGNWTNRAIGATAIGVPAAGYMAFSGSQPQQHVQGY